MSRADSRFSAVDRVNDATTSPRPIFGILYPGEMGSAVGKALVEEGFSVITTTEGRSARTCRLCEEAGLAVVAGLPEVVQAADILVSLVSPSAAVTVAERVVACQRGPGPHLYAGFNSKSPSTARHIDALLAAAGIPFVDGAIHGLAGQLRAQGTLYLSGPSAAVVAAPFERVMRVKVLGDVPGRAAAFKMLMSGMSKGIIALFLEMTLAAQKTDFLGDLLAGYEDYYPGLMTVINRLLPTYRQHAARRGEELREMEQFLVELGQRPCAVRAARELIAELGQLGLPEQTGGDTGHAWSPREVIEAASAHHLLRLRPACCMPEDGAWGGESPVELGASLPAAL